MASNQYSVEHEIYLYRKNRFLHTYNNDDAYMVYFDVLIIICLMCMFLAFLLCDNGHKNWERECIQTKLNEIYSKHTSNKSNVMIESNVLKGE